MKASNRQCGQRLEADAAMTVRFQMERQSQSKKPLLFLLDSKGKVAYDLLYVKNEV